MAWRCSIIMTALSSLLAFGVMPLNVWLYSHGWTDRELQVPYVNIVVSLVFVTVPVFTGMLVRHLSRKWANYFSKVCSLLGWAGALTCAVLLVFRHWDTIIKSSIYLALTAALLPCSGFLIAYVIAKMFCFSHKVCRTVAMETGCQNIVVATSILLLSFTDPQVQGQMVMFPVLYGLCQLGEVFVGTGLFQAWLFAHRNDVTEEAITSVVDTSVLISIPVPAHKDSPAVVEQITECAETPNVCDSQIHPPNFGHTSKYNRRPHNVAWNGPAETQALVDMRLNTQESHRQRNNQPGTPATSPVTYISFDHGYSSTDYPQRDSTDLDSDDVVESVRSYNSEVPCSPTLSNKGVPNMFPVMESDFTTDFQSDFPSDFRSDTPSEREDSPPPYGTPVPTRSARPLHYSHTVQRVGAAAGGTFSPTTMAPHNPATTPRPFAFYHRDVRLGQAQPFSTFERK